jgi:type IV secretory pathway VirB2 component (pilin)
MTSDLPHLPRWMRHANQAGAAVAAFAASAAPAMAQSVQGSVDPATGLSNLSTYVLGLVAAVMVIVAAWKGTHAFMEGRSIGPIAVGLLAGLVLAFGGYYILQHYGVTTTTSI